MAGPAAAMTAADEFKRVWFACALVTLVFPQSSSGAPALQWRENGPNRFLELSVSPAGRAGFSAMPAITTGIHFTNLLSIERGLTNQIFMSGSGVACGDFDGDGWTDIYLCGLDSPSRLYRNLGGWKFADVTERAGAAFPEGAATGTVFADADGDGDLDLLVSGLGRGVRLFVNRGDGSFQDGTDAAGLRSTSAAMTMALADIDGDGDLDLYVANYRSGTFQDEPAVRFRLATTNGVRRITMIDGRTPTPAELIRYAVSPTGNVILENGEADVLYRNDGGGRFSPVSWTDGAFLDESGRPLGAPPYDWGYTAMFRDMNGDGSPDLYVCNDNDSPDRCWINDGTGRFRALGNAALRQASLSSMGIDFADLNRDGFDEFFVADMLGRTHAVRHRQMIDRRPLHPVGISNDRPAYQKNTLFLNRGDGTYAEIGQLAGVDATDWSWQPVFLDVDLDGYEDLLVTTGLERSLRDADERRKLDREKAQRRMTTREFQEMRRAMPRLETPNHAYRNRGDLTFEDRSVDWGFAATLVSQGIALADLDNDGDLDALVNVLNGPALIYRNESPAPRVGVRLRGARGNSRGIGAKIRFEGGPVVQSQEMISGGRYLSGDDALRTFAAGRATNLFTIEVTWRTGRRSRLDGVRANRVYEIDEVTASNVVTEALEKSVAKPWFADVSHLLNHRHHETPFNDFDRQLLLPRRFSQSGPGLCWTDLNRDGRDDLVVGAGRGGTIAVFLNDGSARFQRVDVTDILGQLPDDAATILSAPSSAGTSLWIAVGNYETGLTDHPSVQEYEVGANGVSTGKGLPGVPSSVGPMAMADFDGDGRLDLFVGGRIVAGRYPEPATSRLYRGGTNGFEAVDLMRDQLAPGGLLSGLVSGAGFSDLEGDGYPELLLACEWGPIRVLRNERGKLTAWDPLIAMPGGNRVKLSELTGWWNSVATGDFDGDGRLDLVAGNWGRNTKHQHDLAKPLRILHGDLRGDGRIEGIEARFDPDAGQYVPRRYWETLSMVMPTMQERIFGATAYSRAGLDEVLGDLKPTLREWNAVTLDSMVFLNRGTNFEARPLPLEAQLSPAFGLCVADFDGDGGEDLFVAQNFFGVDPETSRYDAGRGLVLRGDGHGGFRSIGATVSGVDVPGEQRGAAVADFDADGRVDLVVAQNGAETRLFRNAQARPGLRLRVDGGAGNRSGIGAVLQLVVDGRAGAVREIQAGSGYWSQNSAVQIMGGMGTGTIQLLKVRWPGGGATAYEIPAGASEVAVDRSGRLTRLR